MRLSRDKINILSHCVSDTLAEIDEPKKAYHCPLTEADSHKLREAGA